ncbi:cadherin-89D isoform X1 [Diprion similis]|uniref:cadherin-89D isoform X1 n=1 Tax=Diprion similis TaxID=362088 RepID=UPI001EF958DE|nr:cadherin-89D isoform X1 [Diprion similis]XP_046736327.1 cadherin-89D isoform X1 [Diprion similis]
MSAPRSVIFWQSRLAAFLLFVTFAGGTSGCQFYPIGEFQKFVRLPGNLPREHEVLTLEVHPRKHLAIMPVDKEKDARYFSYKELNATHVAIILARSLEDPQEAEALRNVLKFRVVCNAMGAGNSQVSAHLSVTVFVEDVNSYSPSFIDAPYHVTIDELAPVGRTIFRGIHAIDRDKLNTQNSEVHYTIVRGNEEGKFALASGYRAELVLVKQLDYDAGDREFILTIMASDRGIPSRTSNTTVTVLVSDSDDLNPRFTQDVYRTQIYEFYPMLDRPIHLELNFTPPILALDQDRDINARIRYDLTAGNERGFFHLNPENGSLFLEREIDLDAERSLPGNAFSLQIQASQMDNPLRTTLARVEVEVLDLNDNLPEFEVEFCNISIVENLPNGFSVLQVVAVDRDQGENADFDYELEDSSGAFALEAKSGWLTVRDQSHLDREQQSSLRMKVFAREHRPSVVKKVGRSPFVEVEVTLLDANDNNPTFVPSNLYEFMLPSDSPPGTVVGQVQAVDIDLDRNGMVLYHLQNQRNGSARTPFRVDAHTGVISVAESPVIEGRHAIFVEAVDQPANPSERRFSLAVVTVEVFRSGGQKHGEPDFIGSPYEFWVGANVGIGTSVGQIRVNDAVPKDDLIYDLLHSYYEGVPFAVEERSGTITVIDEIEKYDRSLFDFEAQVTDERDLMIVTNVSIHVVDPGDERGIFTQRTAGMPLVFHVKENMPGAFIGQVLPNNGTNSSRNISFLIANQQDVPDISITDEGTLYTPKGLDRETRENYSITVIADNAKGVGIFQVTVIVEDENDNAPMFDIPVYEGRIQENSPVGTEVALTRRITAKDPDDGGNQNFAITVHGEGSELFTIDQVSGRVFFKGDAEGLLDREARPFYNLSLVARDKANLHSEAQLIVTITDENDNAPNFTQMVILPDLGIEVANQSMKERLLAGKRWSGDNGEDDEAPFLTIPENVTLGTPIIRLVALDKDEGTNGEVTYAIANETFGENRLRQTPKAHFVISTSTGEVSVSQALPAGREIVLAIVAVDGGGLFDNVTLKFFITDVNNHSPVFRKSWYLFSVPEGSYHDHAIGTVEAVDADHGSNAVVSYTLVPGSLQVPFSISEQSGVLRVSGMLDRESIDMYEFNVTASDRGTEQLTTSVLVQVNVLDVNDNPPLFWGFDDVWKGIGDQLPVPVYRTSVPENSPVGTVIAKLRANDSDLVGNGNGLVLFDIPHGQNSSRYFSIEGKEGLVKTIVQLDYEAQGLHNVTVTASDLGSPSLTSTAMLIVNVVDPEDGQELRRPVFQHRYYEVEVPENHPVPFKLVQLNLSDSFRQQHVHYTLASTELEIKERFTIDPHNGTLLLISPLDRESKELYEMKVRVDRVKNGRAMSAMIYPVVDDRLNGLEFNEAKIVVRVKDVNDNPPRFKSDGRPMVAAIPTTAHYGYEIMRVEAEDPDEGTNADIRYQIIGREDAPRFAIDPLSGQVRSVGSFSRDAGRVFGFDVKATDRAGADDGRSSIANVFVYVLDDHKQVVMVMGDRPTDIERQIENITSILRNVTGLDVRVRKLEPHIEKNLIDAGSTDMYLYAVDPHLNVMIDMDTLHNVFHNKKSEIKRELEKYHVLEIAGNTPKRANQRYLLSTLEVGVVVLGCVVFVGALVTALCVTCVRRNKRRQQQEAAIFAAGAPVGFALADANGTLQKPGMFPTFVDGLRHYEPESFERDVRHQGVYEHEPSCVRFHRSSNAKQMGRTGPGGLSGLTGLTGLEASAASLHSSGHDSGIVARTCHCSHSSSPSSGESSKSVFYRISKNGYEDSLKSLNRRDSGNEISHGQEMSTVVRRANLPSSRRRHRFHSFAGNGPTSSGSNFASESAFKRSKRRSDPDSLPSETENNVTETVIHEHPSTEGLIPSISGTNASTLHGKSQNVVISTPAAAALTRRQSERFNVMYARPR